ncbi:MAG: hypothetical protein HY699_19910 [Deltaproteobacteria bacterium]|nr:hypothetical protein [Deltaproteobacteria bacterium]
MRSLNDSSAVEISSGRAQTVLFAVGDYVAGALIGAATAAAVRATIYPELDMVMAMLIGMAVGMVVHLVVGLLLTPVVGAFHVMIPGSLIGMYGGMFFAMRDTMQQHAGSLAHAVAIGAVFGLVVTAAVQAYDWVLRSGTTLED